MLQVYTSVLGALIPTLPLMIFVSVFKRVRRRTPDLTGNDSVCCCHGNGNHLTDETFEDRLRQQILVVEADAVNNSRWILPWWYVAIKAWCSFTRIVITVPDPDSITVSCLFFQSVIKLYCSLL